MNFQIHIHPTSPAELQEYLAILASVAPVSVAPIVSRPDEKQDGEEDTIARLYRKTTGRIFRLTKAEIAAGVARLDALKGWQAGGPRMAAEDSEGEGEIVTALPADDGGSFFE